jgi:hypothetical protein
MAKGKGERLTTQAIKCETTWLVFWKGIGKLVANVART